MFDHKSKLLNLVLFMNIFLNVSKTEFALSHFSDEELKDLCSRVGRNEIIRHAFNCISGLTNGLIMKRMNTTDYSQIKFHPHSKFGDVNKLFSLGADYMQNNFLSVRYVPRENGMVVWNVLLDKVASDSEVEDLKDFVASIKD